MRAALVALSALAFAVLPAVSASADGGPPDLNTLVGCSGPYPPCVQEPNGQLLCVIINGNEFCLNPMP